MTKHMTTKEIKEFLRLKKKLTDVSDRVLMTNSYADIVRYNKLLPKFERLKETIISEALEQYEELNK